MRPWTREQLQAASRNPASVPCGSCTACCRHDRVFLGPRDDPHAYRWHLDNGYPVLDRTPDGACVYLGEAGCSIHDSAPEICRRMDCRILVLLAEPEVQARRCAENPQMAKVYAAGRQRLQTLGPPPITRG
ncbi:MAG: YkgJ family cysteine cluster protein [Burkholderiaceae bacterium]|nr:YkgJ family cysteine cluster protein [Burkholderiaceae bacterium]